MSNADLYAEWFFLSYFILLHIGYFILAFLSLFRIGRYLRVRRVRSLPEVYRGYEPGISVIVPAFNEETSILATIRALTGQIYDSVQIVVVNDGSTDSTFDRVVNAYDMVRIELPPSGSLPSTKIRGVYRSTHGEDILLIDKENGHKSDASNAGLNHARYDRVCCMDGDSVLEPESLHRGVRLFVESPDTIATGGTVFVLNGSRIGRSGFIERVGIGTTYWALVQTVEYIRAFLFGRLGWATMNALPIISGAFGMFERGALIAAGGFRRDTIGEDMELTLRLHRYALKSRESYRIDFVPEPVCWTEAPESWTGLQQQRIRWHEGLSESIVMNRELLRIPSFLGWVTMPFIIIFEWFSPFIEVFGYTFALTAFLTGHLSTEALYAFLFAAIGLGVLLSITTLAMEELALRTYPRFGHVLVLCIYAVLENFGYRQLNAAWRCIGFVRWVIRREHEW